MLRTAMIQLEINHNIAEVTLNAPKKMNALDEAAIAELGQAYTDAADAGVRALLLRGEGRGFCAVVTSPTWIRPTTTPMITWAKSSLRCYDRWPNSRPQLLPPSKVPA